MPIKFKGRVVAPELDTLSRVGVHIQLPGAAEDITLIVASNVQRSIKQIGVVLRGSDTPSVTWTLRHGSDRSATGTEVITGGTVTTNVTTGVTFIEFDSAKILPGEHLWLETSDVSGTVNEFALTVNMVDQ